MLDNFSMPLKIAFDFGKRDHDIQSHGNKVFRKPAIENFGKGESVGGVGKPAKKQPAQKGFGVDIGYTFVVAEKVVISIKIVLL